VSALNTQILNFDNNDNRLDDNEYAKFKIMYKENVFLTAKEASEDFFNGK